jgi:hypothetical protein
MSDYEAYIEEQEGRLRELHSKIEIVKTRAGMTEDVMEHTEVRERLVELSGLMKLFEETVEDLRNAGSAWEDMKDSVEKTYLSVKESLRKNSGGLIG